MRLAFLRHNVKGWVLTKEGLPFAFGLTKETRAGPLRQQGNPPGQAVHLYGTNRFFTRPISESSLYPMKGWSSGSACATAVTGTQSRMPRGVGWHPCARTASVPIDLVMVPLPHFMSSTTRAANIRGRCITNSGTMPSISRSFGPMYKPPMYGLSPGVMTVPGGFWNCGRAYWVVT